MKFFRGLSPCLTCAVLLFLFSPHNAFCAENTQPPVQQKRQGVSPAALFTAVLVDAEKGNVRAMLNLGILYEQGIGTHQNFSKTLEWYEKAAAAGSAEGYFRLAICHEVGMGTSNDLGKAVEYYEKAASMGSDKARHKLAAMYIQGRGLPKDEAKGLALLTELADAGNAAACNELAFIYLNGLLNQKKDTAKAKALFTNGAEKGNLEAMKNLAVMLKDGMGQKADPAEALRWYLIAEKSGLQADDLTEIINTLKKDMKPASVKKIEASADKWVAAQKKQAAQNLEQQ